MYKWPQKNRIRILYTTFMTDMFAINQTEAGHGVVGALQRGHSGGASSHALRSDNEPGPTAEQLVVELFPEALAEQIQSKWIYTGIGKS